MKSLFLLRHRLRPASTDTECVADILEREERPLVPQVIARLRLDKGTRGPISVAASDHGKLRREQGYTVAMVVDESRILQVCIFTTLHRNENRVEFSKLLPDVVIIADEVDAAVKAAGPLLPARQRRREEGGTEVNSLPGS